MLRKGFTLIELMVVIAVIGILSSLVLVTYPTAQGRANDGVIMSDADQIRVAAEVSKGMISAGDYSNLGGATGLGEDADINALVTDANSRNGTKTNFAFHYTVDDTTYTDYCAVIQMNSGDFWCVDSNYYGGNEGNSTNCASATFCGAGGAM